MDEFILRIVLYGLMDMRMGPALVYISSRSYRTRSEWRSDGSVMFGRCKTSSRPRRSCGVSWMRLSVPGLSL